MGEGMQEGSIIQPTKKHKGRKPFVFNYAQVEELASQGLNQEQIAHNIGVNPKTLTEKKNIDPELVLALEKGRARGIKAVVNVIFQAAMKGQSWACCFWMKNVSGWADQPQNSLAIQVNTQMNVPPLFSKDVEPLVKAILEAKD
jgi:DNA-binding XRE family transcriptional regulator